VASYTLFGESEGDWSNPWLILPFFKVRKHVSRIESVAIDSFVRLRSKRTKCEKFLIRVEIDMLLFSITEGFHDLHPA
jgi:hypothetical protein